MCCSVFSPNPGISRTRPLLSVEVREGVHLQPVVEDVQPLGAKARRREQRDDRRRQLLMELGGECARAGGADFADFSGEVLAGARQLRHSKTRAMSAL